MNDRIALITGATQGIGRVAAERIAPSFGTVVLVARDPKRGDDTRAAVQKASPQSKVEVLLGDLSSLADVRRIAQEFRASYDRLHLLVNNAGAIFTGRETTVDGFEKTFALNHLAYFLLTHELIDVLKASAPARVVSVSSGAHNFARNGIQWDDLHFERYSSMGAYGQSKLANILFTTELARRLKDAGVTANCLHPGAVSTGFGRNDGRLFNLAIRAAQLFMLTPEQGADTIIYLATSPEVEGQTGKYFYKRREKTTSKHARDDAAAARLWQLSAELCKVAG
jgi:NAD(P)-dependent dehydrogenase (short-subunit alcohol dehydrogenase family)